VFGNKDNWFRVIICKIIVRNYCDEEWHIGARINKTISILQIDAKVGEVVM
jgi:hypothetical protein